jgi:flagellar protein FlgJ
MNINSLGSSILNNATTLLPNQSSSPASGGGDFANRLNQAVSGQSTVTSDKKLKAVCKDMESVFMNMMLTTMRATVPKDSLLGDSNEDGIMKSMLDTEMSKNMAQAGGVGLADLLYRQLSPQTKQSPVIAK